MASSEDQFKNHLRTVGERVTAPRLAVFGILARQSPLSMPALIASASGLGVDPATVYRTLELFRSLGLIQEVGLGRNRLFELSDSYHAHHHHFMCTNCGKLTDFDSNAIEAGLAEVAKNLGFQVRGHQLEVVGLCKACLRVAQPNK